MHLLVRGHKLLWGFMYIFIYEHIATSDLHIATAVHLRHNKNIFHTLHKKHLLLCRNVLVFTEIRVWFLQGATYLTLNYRSLVS